MSARDPLRARLPKGFIAARDSSAPRFAWSWPIGLALLSVFALAGFFTWRVMASVTRKPGEGRMPVHPTTGALAMLGLWTDIGFRERRGEEEGTPLHFAAWSDGTILWSEAAATSGGHPYRIAHVALPEVQALAVRVRAMIEGVPQDRRSNFVLDSGFDELSVGFEDEYVRLRWWTSMKPDSDPVLGKAWRDVRALLLSAIPTQGSSIALDEVKYEFRR